MAIELIEAEVIGEAAGPQDILRFDAEAIRQSVIDMSAALEKAAQKADLYDIADEQVRKEELKDLRTYRADINAVIAEYDTARKEFKRRIMAPYDEAEAKGKAIIEPLKTIQNRMKREIDTRAARLMQERSDSLKEHYIEYAPALAEAVPFERILETTSQKWLLQSTKYEKAERELEDAVIAISKDWEALRSTELKVPDETKAEFLRTLNIGVALAFDRARAEEKARVEALEATVEENIAAAVAPDPEPPAPVHTYDVTPEGYSETPESMAATRLWVCAFEGTSEDKAALIGFMRDNGLHGMVKESHYGSVKEAMSNA